MGANIETSPGKIRLRMNTRPRALDITTACYPGFPTDLQPAAMSALAIAEGVGSIRETIFENRFLHVMELLRLGADIVVNGDRAVITGVEKIEGAEVMASDIRAGAGLILAGLAAHGTTEILRCYHIDRGYENIEKTFQSLGANIKRVDQYSWKK